MPKTLTKTINETSLKGSDNVHTSDTQQAKQDQKQSATYEYNACATYFLF